MKTIKSSSEISHLFENGRRVSASCFSLIVLRNENQHDRDGRVAFIAGKKLGNAVWRNRAKRRMRALCAAKGGSFPGYDVAFVARRGINDEPFEKMLDNMDKALEKAGISVE